MPPRALHAPSLPGRVNVIGEHTDYNRGLALPFAIAEGITVRAAVAAGRRRRARRARMPRDLGEQDEFPLGDPPARARDGAPSCAAPSPS